MTKSQQIALARRMAQIADALGDQDSQIGRLLDQAHASAAQEERQHRALGRRLVGDIGTRISVDNVAWLFTARAFFLADASASLVDVAGLRDDYRLGLFARVLAEKREMYRADPTQTLFEFACQKLNIPGKLGEPYGLELLETWNYSTDVAGDK